MITPEQSEELGQAAEQTLSAFDTISHAARSRLATGPRTPGDALAVQNAFTSEKAYDALGDVERSEREACERLAREPTIARVIVENEDGNRDVIYVARAVERRRKLHRRCFPTRRAARAELWRCGRAPNSDTRFPDPPVSYPSDQQQQQQLIGVHVRRHRVKLIENRPRQPQQNALDRPLNPATPPAGLDFFAK